MPRKAGRFLFLRMMREFVLLGFLEIKSGGRILSSNELALNHTFDLFSLQRGCSCGFLWEFPLRLNPPVAS